jgi:butyryl-CoA dehydrogenase
MDFKLTEEQQLIRSTARDFATNEIEPVAEEYDTTKEFPWENVKKMAELGFMGMFVPEQYKGSAADYISYAIVTEELSRADGAHGVVLSAHSSLGTWPILAYGTEEQKKKYLPLLATGKRIAAFGLTEPNAGSDASGQQTTAVLQGDEWILNGSKIFITNGGVAEVLVVFAMTDKAAGARGISAFIVEKSFPGFKVGKRENTLGIHASNTSELIFTDMRVPKENLLGPLGKGYRIALETLDGGRIGIGAQALGIGQASLEASSSYAQQRVQFGKPISSLQAIQWMIADMATQVAAARYLVYNAAFLKDTHQPYAKEAAMAKLFASDMAMKAATNAIQVHGGYGYIKDYPVERYFRDAKITQIYEGTNEVMRLVIANNILKTK